MERIKIVFILLLLSYCSCVSAQKKMSKKQFIIDSTNIVKPKLVRPQFRFDNRLIFTKNGSLRISGADAGVLLKNKLRVTLGYYSLSEQPKSLTKTINSIEYQGQYKSSYGALNMEFIYKDKRFFSLGMPLEFGMGINSLNYTSEINNLETGNKSGFIAMSYFGISGTFKPIRWIGLKGAFGYKKTLYNQVKNSTFDGIYTSLGLAIDFKEIIMDYKMLKLKKRYRKNSNSLETAVDLMTD